MTDLLLALAHHFLAFSLAAILAAEIALLAPGLTGARLKLLARLDSAYGAFAGLLLLIGFGRVFYGVRGPEFFLANPWFWAKIACFGLVAFLSAPPTIRYFAWGRRAKGDAGYAVTSDDVRTVRRFLAAEAAFFVLIPLLAAAMVRVPFL